MNAMMHQSYDEEIVADDELSPLLAPRRLTGSASSHHRVPASIARRLYISHFLSTWNSRVFEFGAVLYLVTIYPGTLMPMSLYALVCGLSAIILAPTVGLYIDTGNRLQVARTSIVFERIVVAASCAIFYVLAVNIPLNYSQRMGMLALVSIFACIEKLCSIMNLVSVEKDWVFFLYCLLRICRVVLMRSVVQVVVITDKDPEALAIINSQMRRIDLLCKLFGPLFIALIDGYSPELAIIVNFAMNAASIVVEYFAIAKVYRDAPKLQEPKHHPQAESVETATRNDTSRLMTMAWKRVLALLQKSAQDFSFYFHHRAFLPSIAGAMLYLTVLSFAGQMVTYLLSAGYSSVQIGIARTLSVVLEVLATWVAPWLMRRINPLRAELWLSSWQVVMLTGGIAVFWIWEENPLISASGLVGGTILSRVGLRGFDLCVQLIVQEDVEAESRGAFSSVEVAWQNAFELLSFASTMVFYHPDQFKWPSLISALAVMTASISYTVFVYLRRGHLLHIDGLMRLLGARGGEQQQRDRAIDRINSTTSI
ncbi:iron transporter [Fusarium albosuccineum]|uniref:Solute carrier family 40 member n=1 Tax=Fusarium albosuccineum TaxID=1237068 RepID=A0A8H4L5E7_9HYPO|nr:iron transporter [Fusarium albosuccineum]